MSSTYVIVGASLCGATAARTLRDAGFDGRVVVVGDELDRPYERPPLSKEYLQGTGTREALDVQSADWYGEHDVELMLGVAARRLDPGRRVVELADGTQLDYDRVLIATGGRPRHMKGVTHGDRILYLRTRQDADALAAHLQPDHRLAIVGAGFIGCEVAASARRRGADVTMLEITDVPLEHAVGVDVGEAIAAIHRDEGVDVRTGEQVVSVKQAGETVLLETSRTRLEADVVVVGVGIEPNVELVHGTDVRTDDGILVDQRCRTSVDGVFAAGDVARHYHPVFGRHLRVEHYDNAIKQGTAAAESMLDREIVFDDPHWFWSDQYDHTLQSVGVPGAWDELVLRGSLKDRSFTAFYLERGHVRAVFTLNRPKDVLRARKLVHSQAPVDPAQVRDESVDLRTLTKQR